jgi:copper chaperone NosL
MFVARYPRWVASVAWQEGAVAFFDGPRDLFHYLLHPERYRGGASAGGIAAIFVTEYYTGAALPAREALYITGSDVMGPMGRELVPVRGDEPAATFQRDHQGRRVLRFEEVTDAVLAEEP